jgi:oxygen-independent coproporphyrinogen-3 oxidase
VAAGGAWSGADTLYLGGGTPSALVAEDLEGAVDCLVRGLGLRREGAGAVHLLLEANPEDVTAASAVAWRRLGVATLSLGVQSLDPGALALLGRHHDPGSARRVVEVAQGAGFATVSLDLIYGWPGQTPERWRRDLAAALELSPDHLSCYQLTVEPRTAFGVRRARGKLVEMPEDDQARLFRLTHEVLADAGLPAYEVSNFARTPAHRSPHNQKYWRGAPYLGLGPSAHSFDGRRRRWWNERRLAHWRSRVERGEPPRAGEEELSARQLALEALMLGLRTADGIDLAAFRHRHGVDLAAVNAVLLARLAEDRLARLDDGRLALTLEGLAVADGLAAQLELD